MGIGRVISDPEKLLCHIYNGR